MQEARDRAVQPAVREAMQSPSYHTSLRCEPATTVHISALESAGISDLRDSEKVSYDLVPAGNTGKTTATELELLG